MSRVYVYKLPYSLIHSFLFFIRIMFFLHHSKLEIRFQQLYEHFCMRFCILLDPEILQSEFSFCSGAKRAFSKRKYCCGPALFLRSSFFMFLFVSNSSAYLYISTHRFVYNPWCLRKEKRTLYRVT